MNIPVTVRLLYLVLMPTIGFIFDDPWVIIGLLLAQLLLWFGLGIPLTEFSHLRRIRKFAFFLLLVFSLFSATTDIPLVAIRGWQLGFSYTGFATGLLMISKIAIMLLVAQIVYYTTPAKQLIAGLQKLGMSEDSALVMNSLLQSTTKRSNKNKDNRRERKKPADKESSKAATPISLRSILKGDLEPIYEFVDRQRDKINSEFSNSSLAHIASSSALIVLVRFVKIAPGLPIAPGHKNVLIIPLFILGAHNSSIRFAGARIGFFSGVIHFLSGFGKYGPLGVLQFLLLGAVIDLLLLLLNKPNSIVAFAWIGLIAGLFRVSTEIFLAWLLDVPLEFYMFYLPFILSHCIFGVVSAPVSKRLLSRNSSQ